VRALQSRATPEFWEHYQTLPLAVRLAADKQFQLFAQNPGHPSLKFKRVGELWSVRVTEGYRALAIQNSDTLYWFWIGSHDDYELLLR